MPPKWSGLGKAIGETFAAIYALVDALKHTTVDTSYAAYWAANDGQKAKELVKRLLDWLVVAHAQSHHAAVFPVLSFLGLVEKINYTPAAADTTYAVAMRELRVVPWDRLRSVFSPDPSVC